MRLVQFLVSITGIFFLFSAGGCALNSSNSKSAYTAPVAERDILVDAASNLRSVPWPEPETQSIFSRIAGTDNPDLVTRDEAVEFYVTNLDASGSAVNHLKRDVAATLRAAYALNETALRAIGSPRLSANDVSTIEDAIQTLQSHRQIYSAAAKMLRKSGADISSQDISQIRDDLRLSIKDLGKTADLVAERVEQESTLSYAGPAQGGAATRAAGF